MADPFRHCEGPTTVEWVKALVIVVLVAILVIATLIWFALTFVLQGCCVVPTPAL